MRARSVVLALAAAAGSVGALAFWRRSRAHRERVDLYFADGSTVSVAARSPDAERLLPLARDALAVAA